MPAAWRSMGLVLLSSTSLQVGLAIAATTFTTVGALRALWVRSGVGAILLAFYIRPRVRSFTAAQLMPITLYGLSLASMTAFAYLAIAGAPLGVVSAVLMLGPLSIAAWGNRTLIDAVLIVIAGVGVLALTLAHETGRAVGTLSVVSALAAAGAFAAYIITGKRVSQRVEGLGGLAIALMIAALVQTPLAVVFGHGGIPRGTTALALVAAGVLATLIPFSLEAVALRRLSMATFGLLLAFEPAIAAMAGVAIRGDSLAPQQIAGIALVVVAASGSLGPRGWTRSIRSYDRLVMRDPNMQDLARVPLFGRLAAGDLAAIGRAMHERHTEVGEVIIREGDEGDEFFIIEEGSVTFTHQGSELRRLGPGDYFGEIALLFGGTRTATATADRPTRLLVLQRDNFLSMLKRHPRVEDNILTTVADRMRYR